MPKKKKRRVKKRKSRPARARPKRIIKAVRVADVLASISIWFLLITAVLSILFTNVISQKVAELGFSLEKSDVYISMGIWIILAALTFVSNKFVKVNLDRHQMWGLLIVGILMALSAYISPILVLIPAALVIIAALIYLLKSR